MNIDYLISKFQNFQKEKPSEHKLLISSFSHTIPSSSRKLFQRFQRKAHISAIKQRHSTTQSQLSKFDSQINGCIQEYKLNTIPLNSLFNIQQCDVEKVKKNLKASKSKRAPRRKCSFLNCTNKSVSRGLCIQHGGGKRCQHENCDKGAKNGLFCWKHGIILYIIFLIHLIVDS